MEDSGHPTSEATRRIVFQGQRQWINFVDATQRLHVRDQTRVCGFRVLRGKNPTGFVDDRENSRMRAENITSCAIFIATLADATKTMRLGTGTVNLPNTHPVAVASAIAMLDHLLDGRLIFGISPGGLLSDAEAFGNLDKDRTAMFVEAIDMVLDLWRLEPPYDLRGKFWEISTRRSLLQDIGQGLVSRPLQRPHPPIAVTAVAPHSKGLAAAAARGWLPISANFLLPCWVVTHWPKYEEGCASVGRVAQVDDWRVARSIFVADDMKTAREYALGPDSPYRYYYTQLLAKMIASGRGELFKVDPNSPDSELTVDALLESLVTWGTPEKVADDLNEFRETVGQFGTLLYAGKDWLDPVLARRSMELLATEVLPRISTTSNREQRVG